MVRSWGLAASLLLAGAVTLFYGTLSLHHGFLYDDERLVLGEVAPQGFGDYLRVLETPHYGELPYYRPLSRVTYVLQKGLSGENPRPYHLFNAGLAGLVVLAACSLLRSPGLMVGTAPALAASLLCALHPVTSSCVFPIAGRETLLAALFVLTSVAAHLRSGWRWRALSLAALGAALFSKEQALMTPLLYAAADLLVLPRRPTGATAWLKRYAPVAAVVFVYWLARSLVLEGTSPGVAFFADPVGPLRSLAYGVQTSFLPFAELRYEPAYESWISAPRLLLAGLLFGALCVALARQSGRPWKAALFWVLWFGIAQLPSANFFEQESAFDERYVFVGWLGLVGLCATLVSATWPRRRVVVTTIYLSVLVAMVRETQARAPFFSTPANFHRQWVRTSPRSAGAHNGWGVTLAREGRLEEAVEEYETAIRLGPRHAQSRNNLGVALAGLDRIVPAIASYREALSIKPGYAQAHYNLANALAEAGGFEEAESHYRDALAIHPHYAQAHNNYAALLVRRGKIEQAKREFLETIRLDPSHARARMNYGILLVREGRAGEAVPYYEQALALAPRSAEVRFNLAQALIAHGRLAEALLQLREAVALRPDWPEALQSLAAAQAEAEVSRDAR